MVRQDMFIGFFAFALERGPAFAKAVVDQICAGGGPALLADVFKAGLKVASAKTRSPAYSRTMRSRLPRCSPSW
ncbi:hypothetical protein A1D31_39880 [Bradyrhizobium liaoningense]|nr:hypothetical protein A1D31_39880 [Bradyrhizobium liaoningense]